MGFLKFILIVVGIYYLLKWLFPVLFTWFIARNQRKFAEQMGSGYGQPTGNNRRTNSNRQQKKEGEIRVERTREEGKKVSKSVGDYVEFEEVEEITEE